MTPKEVLFLKKVLWICSDFKTSHTWSEISSPSRRVTQVSCWSWGPQTGPTPWTRPCVDQDALTRSWRWVVAAAPSSSTNRISQWIRLSVGRWASPAPPSDSTSCRSSWGRCRAAPPRTNWCSWPTPLTDTSAQISQPFAKKQVRRREESQVVQNWTGKKTTKHTFVCLFIYFLTYLNNTMIQNNNNNEWNNNTYTNNND